MDPTLAVSILALVVSVIALLASALLSHRQVRAMRDANYLSVITDLTLEYRRRDLYDNTVYLCNRFARENHDPSRGLSGLPPEVRAKVLDAAYYYQAFAWLIAEGVLGKKGVYISVITRIAHIWPVIEHFVHFERDNYQGSCLGSLETTYVLLVDRREIKDRRRPPLANSCPCVRE